MRILQGKNPNFIVFPNEEAPDAELNRWCWMWRVQKGEEDPTFADERRGIQSYHADTKVRGGGVFPCKWRDQRACYQIPEDVEFPLDESDKDRIVNFINKKEFGGEGTEPKSLSSHELEYIENRNGFSSFRDKYPELNLASKLEIKYRL